MQAGDSSPETGTYPSLLAFLARNRIQMSSSAFRFMCSAQLEVVVIVQAGCFSLVGTGPARYCKA